MISYGMNIGAKDTSNKHVNNQISIILPIFFVSYSNARLS